MSTKEFLLSLARGARGKEAAKALILPQIFGGLGKVNAGKEYEISGTPPLSLPNSLGKPLKAWSVDVLPYQEGTGDPAPDNVRPIHGTDKLTITTAGSNIFDFAQLANQGTNPVAVDNGYQFLLNGAQFSTGVPVSYGTNQITLSGYVKCITATNVRFRLAFSDGTFQDGTGTSATEPTLLTMTSYVNKQVVAIRLNWSQTGTCEVTNFMVNIGTDALPYEPYNATPTVLTLPQTVYTGTIGSDGGESRSAMVDLGDLEYSLNTHGSTYNSFFTNGVAIKAPSSGADVIHAICSGLKSLSYGASWTPNSIAPHTSTSNLMRVILPTTVTTAQECKEYVSGMKLVYERETPTTFALPSVTIPTPTGTATTWAVAQDGTVDSMSVTYVGKA